MENLNTKYVMFLWITIYLSFDFAKTQRSGDYVTMEQLGCWKDGYRKLISPLEGHSSFLDGRYNTRVNAIQKCARAAMSKGYRMFVLQDGGWCGSSYFVANKYHKLGKSTNCESDGKGGYRANMVYKIVGSPLASSRLRTRKVKPFVARPDYLFENGKQKRPIHPNVYDMNEGDVSHDYILNDLGCWAIPSNGVQNVEGILDDLDGHYKYRSKAVQKCAKALSDLGYTVMAIHDGGKCLAVDDINAVTRLNGRRKSCSYSGKGTSSSVQVYEIRYSKLVIPPGPQTTTKSNTPPWVIATLPYAPRPTRFTLVPTRYTRSPPRFTRSPPGYTRLPTVATPRTVLADSSQEYKHYKNLGCWNFAWNDTIPSIEGRSSILDGHYSQRTDAVKKCAKAAQELGYDVIAVQDGGRCASSPDARQRFANLGRSTYCRSDGRGGSWVNQVYEINVVWDVRISGLGCYSAGSPDVISSLEGTSDLLDGEYYRRKDAIRKCSKAAATRGFRVFALQDDGKCLSDSNGRTSYSTNHSSSCPRNGRGGFQANEVYEIISASKMKLKNLGCWKDKSSRAVPGMEQTDGDLMDNFKIRKDAIGKCARVAKRNGFKVFVVQDGGWCGGSRTAKSTYSRYGKSTSCKSDGEGGTGANQVFEILN